MKRLSLVGLLTVGGLCLLGRLAGHGQSLQQPLIQTTGDIEVRILAQSTELSLPPGTHFVVGEEPGGRIVLRFRRITAPPGSRPGVP